MMKIRIGLLAALGVSVVASYAQADGYIAVSGGASFPIGDDDWTRVVESSPTVAVRGGGGRKISSSARLALEGSFEFSPLSTDADSAIVDISLTRYRALIGARLEQRIARGALVALRGGVGIDHLRSEVSSSLLPGFSDTDSDTGLALEAGVGLWFSAGPVLVGVETALPIGFHSDGSDDQSDAALDFQNIDLSLLVGIRFHL